MRHTGLIIMLCACVFSVLGQGVKVRISPDRVHDPVVFIDHTDQSFTRGKDGTIHLPTLPPGEHVLTVFAEGYASATVLLEEGQRELDVALTPLQIDLDVVEILDFNRSAQGMSKLRYIEVDGIYAAKKNEIVLPAELAANRSTNNSRQIFAKVPGVNVQETDAGGLQMGIGARGLDPKRTTNFNVRQDGYDISADALGYPESYYTPPMEAVERIELVRGAASLQYGTQFGGLLNFKMKRGVDDRPFELVQRTTLGSYDHFGSFTSIGGSSGEWNYYGYFQHKEGNGWRPNSHYVNNGAYFQAGRKLGERWSIDVAYTHNFYNAKQPGGLTDRQYEVDPSVSFRDRNWFKVQWNVASATVNGKLTEGLTINSKTFLLRSSRAALGFLGNINRVDTGGQRDLILGEFNNLGNETRLIQRFDFRGAPGAVLVGTRLYQGETRNRQGKASAGSDADYRFVSDAVHSGSDFDFPSQNAALFAEALLPLSSCWYLTPGVRLEHIRTRSDGAYTEVNYHPLTGEVLSSETVTASSDRPRQIALFGIGATWKCRPQIEFYANASQNYRAMNFSDLYVSNPNLVIAQDMKDETGFTVDLGAKGALLDGALQFDAGMFIMHYDNRIGEMLTVIENEEGVRRIVNYRDNIADARFVGVEIFEELNITQLLKSSSAWQVRWYNNLAVVEARYDQEELKVIDGNRVENVPRLNYKSGLNVNHRRFSGGVQYNGVSAQFTDATNATYFPDATVGTIPAYHVLDMSVSYEWSRIRLEGSINNLTDAVYFTRRATGYPGPGIIPAERRMFFMTLQFKL